MGTPHNEATEGRFRQNRSDARRPSAGQIHRGKFPDGPEAGEQCPGRAGLYRHFTKGRRCPSWPPAWECPPSASTPTSFITQYDVENIIRVGSAGALRADLELGSVVAGQGACTNSNYINQYRVWAAPLPPLRTLTCWMAAVQQRRRAGRQNARGQPLFCRHVLRRRRPRMCAIRRWASWRWKWKRPLCTATPPRPASGHWPSAPFPTIWSPAKNCPPADRQTTFTNMMKIALETAVKMAR